MTKLLPLALLAVSSSVASAQTYVAADGISYAQEPMYKQVDARLGLLLGGSDVGDADGFSVAQGPEMEGVTATCGGPCTEATKPSRTDVSMFFELGVHWGR